MPPKGKVGSKGAAPNAEEALAWLKAHAKKKIRAEMEPRYGIRTDKAFGVSMADMQKLARKLGTNHELALKLWDTGCYEARTVAALIDDPQHVTSSQMDRWCRDFDSWGICDTVCFKLFDRVPHAFAKVEKWSTKKDEFAKRAAFALLASLALHDKSADDRTFIRLLELVERAANDERNFVKKGVSWALRSVGRRNAKLNQVAVELSKRLIESGEKTSTWIGKEAMKELTSAAVVKEVKKKIRA